MVQPEFRGRVTGFVEHLRRHVDTDDAAAGADHVGRHETVESGSGTNVDDPLARVHRMDREWIADAGERLDRLIGKRIDHGAVIAEAFGQRTPGVEVVLAGGIDRGGDPAALADRSDVLVDFSAPVALEANLHAAIGAGIPIVIGTTGLEDRHHRAIDNAARQVAVLQTGNTSLGVTLLARLVREAAASLGPEWDIEIVEMHHRMKVDAPSGTALLLGEAAAAGRGIDLADYRESGRDGHTGARQQGAIGFAALRGGTVAGEHSVIVAGEEERLTLSHSAENRMIFARGAVKAAQWLIGRDAGRYAMDDILSPAAS